MQFIVVCILASFVSCSTETKTPENPNLTYNEYKPNNSDIVLSRETYYEKLQGFWLGTCIANWTGIVTENDKVGNTGILKTGDFYTR